MSMTMAEKILARASGRADVRPGEFVTATIDKFMCHEAMAAVFANMKQYGFSSVKDPERLIVALDHYAPAPTVRASEIHKTVRAAVSALNIRHFYDTNAGVGHQIMVENGHVLPGELVVSSDSHTCMYGALGAASCGVGFAEMTYALVTGTLWFRVPETVRFVLKGTLKPLVSSKDIILYIAGRYKSSAALYKSAEFTGPLAHALSIESRLTISNMAVEIGAKFGFFPVDGCTEAYFSERGVRIPAGQDHGDDAPCAAAYEIDGDALEPQVALPHTVDNVAPIGELPRIPIHQAVLGSCTNGRTEDLTVAAELLAGKKVHPGVRFYVVPASMDICRQAMRDGTMETLASAGALILNPGCGPCFGAHMGLLAAGERCVSSTNRNFRGRMGSGDAEVYLASPATVAVSALKGYIADPRG